MKVFRFGVLCFVFIFCLLVSGVFSKVEATGFVTDLCWNVSFSDGSTATLKLGLFEIGGKHYLLSGKATASGTEMPMHGNAEIFSDNQIHSTLILTSSGSSSVTDMIFDVVLDTSLNGNFKGNYVKIDSSNTTSKSYVSGSMTYTTCQ